MTRENEVEKGPEQGASQPNDSGPPVAPPVAPALCKEPWCPERTTTTVRSVFCAEHTLERMDDSVCPSWEDVAQRLEAERLEHVATIDNLRVELAAALTARDIARAEAFDMHVSICRRLSEMIELIELGEDLVETLAFVLDRLDAGPVTRAKVSQYKQRVERLKEPTAEQIDARDYDG